MNSVTFAEARSAVGVPFTVADLEATPDDGRRYELLAGALVVSPRPTTVLGSLLLPLARRTWASSPSRRFS